MSLFFFFFFFLTGRYLNYAECAPRYAPSACWEKDLFSLTSWEGLKYSLYTSHCPSLALVDPHDHYRVIDKNNQQYVVALLSSLNSILVFCSLIMVI